MLSTVASQLGVHARTLVTSADMSKYSQQLYCVAPVAGSAGAIKRKYGSRRWYRPLCERGRSALVTVAGKRRSISFSSCSRTRYDNSWVLPISVALLISSSVCAGVPPSLQLLLGARNSVRPTQKGSLACCGETALRCHRDGFRHPGAGALALGNAAFLHPSAVRS
jgi:hypothetical protein